MRLSLVLIVLILLFIPVLTQEMIKEEVEVKWWIIPMFAVDKKDNSVVDLKETDLELYLDNVRIENFTLFRRDFNV